MFAQIPTTSVIVYLVVLLLCLIAWYFSPARRERLEWEEIERRRADSNYLQELCAERAPVSCVNAKGPEYYTLEYEGSHLLVRNHRNIPDLGPQMELVNEIEIDTRRNTATCWQGWHDSPDENEISLGDLTSELDLIFGGKPVYRYAPREEFALR